MGAWLPPTPPSTLRRARAIARRAGLRFVYTGNVHDLDGDATACPACGAELIARDWYELLAYRVTADGRCAACGTGVPGRFAEAPGHFGRRRVALRLST